MTPEEQQLVTNIHTEFSTLAKKQVTVSYTLIGILFLVLSLFGGVEYLQLKQYDKLETKAEQQEQKYEASQQAFLAQIKAHDDERDAALAQVTNLQAQIAARAKSSPPPVVQTGLKPTATPTEIEAGLVSLFPDWKSVIIAPDSNLELTDKQSQDVISRVYEGDRAKLDLNDTTTMFNLEKKALDDTTSDLKSCRDLNAVANKTIADYKSVSKKSKWQKLYSGIKIAGAIVAAAAIGHVL